MNGIDEINKKRLYYEGLKQAIALPLPEELGHDLEEIFQDEETNEAIKETIRFWKEVEGPFVNAIAFIYNNRFIIEEKDALIKTDDETPFMMPDEFFNILKTLLKATVTEFLSVLHIPSNKKAKLLECVEHNDKAGFVSVMEHADCDTTALAKLCALCKDNASTGFEMKDDDFTYYLDYMASHLHEKDGADNKKMIEALKCWQPSAELLDDDDSDEALNRYFSDYRHFLETDLATNLHYYWDWHGDFTLKERNLIDPILDNPLAKNLIAAIREEYENPKPQPTEPIVGIQQMPQIEEPTIEEPQPEQLSAADYNQVIPDALTTEHLDLIKEFEIGKRYFARKKRDYVQPHCMLLNEGFNVMADEDKANRFERLMKLLARTRCIYPSILVMRSCAYAMTGYGFYNPFKPVPVFWNREKVDILLYICQKFYNKRGNTKTPMSKFKNPAEVFHVIKEYQEASNHSQSASKVDTSDFGKDFKAIFPEL